MVLGEMRVRNVSGKAQKVLAVSEATGSFFFFFFKKVPDGKTVICRRDFTKSQILCK